MKTDYVKLAILGLKIVAAVAGGIAVFVGMNKLIVKKDPPPAENNTTPPLADSNSTRNENNNSPEWKPQYHQDNTGVSNAGVKIINGIKVGQAALAGTMNLVQNVATIATNINKLFDPEYYKSSMLGDPMASSGYFGPRVVPGYAAGNYPWNRPNDPGLPYDTPIYRGNGNAGDDIYWVRKGNNLIEVWG